MDGHSAGAWGSIAGILTLTMVRSWKAIAAPVARFLSARPAENRAMADHNHKLEWRNERIVNTDAWREACRCIYCHEEFVPASKLSSGGSHRHPIIVCNAGPSVRVGEGICICLREIDRLYKNDAEHWEAVESLKKIIATLEAENKAQGCRLDSERWRTLDDKKPPPGRGVLVWSPGNKCQYMAHWDGKKWQPWDLGAEERANLSHWKPLGPVPVGHGDAVITEETAVERHETK